MTQNDDSVTNLTSISDSSQTSADLNRYFSHAPLAIAVVSSERYHFTVANAPYLALISKTYEEVIGKPAFDVLPELESSLKPLLDDVVCTGERYQANEFPLDFIKDGVKTRDFFNFIYEPIKDYRGNVTGVFVTGQKVTDQVEAKLKLQENQHQLRMFADAMPVLISYIDRNERYQLTNKLYEEWFGESGDKVKGMSMLEMLGVKAYEAIHPYVVRALAGERVTYESKVHYRNKGETYIHATYIPDKAANNEVRGFFVLVEDVTERRLTDDKIKKSESHFRKMTDTVPAIIWLTDKTGYCTYLNKYWYDTTGQTEKEALGFGWLNATHRDDSESAEKAFVEANANQTEFLTTYRLRHANGEYRWVIDRGSPRYDAAGKFEGMTGSVVEIHQQKEAEEKIRESGSQYRALAEQLEKLVGERTRELQRSNEDLQQFAHVASHDLKEPVRKVKTFIDKLLLDYQSEIPAKALEYLKKIDKSCDRMNTMVEGVLQYSKMNALDNVSEKVDVADLIENIESDLEVVITRKNANIIKHELPQVNGSPILLYQLFYNLINNSLKFSLDGIAPVITISSRKPTTTEVQTAGPDSATSYVLITVADNGIGFEEHAGEKIFGTFTRLNAKDQFEGTGLGLALCRTIVTRHGGAIWAQGENNKGATFSILLPE
jgi:PAS domain S-box-containing protein